MVGDPAVSVLCFPYVNEKKLTALRPYAVVLLIQQNDLTNVAPAGTT